MFIRWYLSIIGYVSSKALLLNLLTQYLSDKVILVMLISVTLEFINGILLKEFAASLLSPLIYLTVGAHSYRSRNQWRNISIVLFYVIFLWSVYTVIWYTNRKTSVHSVTYASKNVNIRIIKQDSQIWIIQAYSWDSVYPW